LIRQHKGSIKGAKMTLADLASVSDVRFFSHASVGNVRLAIYDDSAPKNLLWQSVSTTNTTANGWIIIPTTSGLPSTLTLAFGSYWLAWQVDSTFDVPSYTAGTNGDGFVFNQPFGNFPVSLDVPSTNLTGEKWSMYVTYNPVQPTAPVLTSFSATLNGSFQMQLLASSNFPVSIFVSTDLLTWTAVATNLSGKNGVFQFVDTNTAGFPRRFYRARAP
jgi:hypothetical protein